MGYFKTIYTDIQELYARGVAINEIKDKYPFLSVNEIWEIIEETSIGSDL